MSGGEGMRQRDIEKRIGMEEEHAGQGETCNKTKGV
jgi:hypothetical protein